MKKKFLGLMTRCRDEFFIKEFCDYYLRQGVDSIYIIDDDSEDKSIYDFSKNQKYKNVNIRHVDRMYADATTASEATKNIDVDETNKLFREIKNLYEWLIYVDVDEFIVTKKNFNKTLADELRVIFKTRPEVHCIAVPWVMMSGANLKKNPKSVLKEVLHRHDHDKRHPHKIKKFKCRYQLMDYKCIFKPSKYARIHDHGPFASTFKHFLHRIKVLMNCDESLVNGVDLKNERLRNWKFQNLRERCIREGVFLNYHYRYISDENSKNKLITNSFYSNDGYSFEDLKSSSYPEIKDETMLKKLK